MWDDPDAFDVERFAGREGRHRFQYLPFGGGPRTCVGAQFAIAEALTILAHWLGAWRFAEAGHDVRVAGHGDAATERRPAADPRATLNASGDCAIANDYQ